MARTKIPLVVFRDTGAFAANASVTINNRATGTQATVYSTETGAVLPQPLTCDARGRCPGWVDRGKYTAIISGTGVTSYSEDFDSTPGGDGAIDQAWLANAIVAAQHLVDYAVTQQKIQQDVDPVGEIAMWWRPAASVPLPAKWVECRGQTLVAGQHDFPVAGSVVLPDMRNAFPLGAASATADGTAGVAETVAGAAPSVGKAPGIGGVQGSHARALAHSHTINDHTHYVPWPFGENGGGGNWVGYLASNNQTALQNMGYTMRNRLSGFSTTPGMVGKLNDGSSAAANNGWMAGYDNRQTDVGDYFDVASTGASNRGTDTQLSGTQDTRPGSVGLLFIVKVKNS